MTSKPSAPTGFTLERQLGEGASSRVWLGKHNGNQKYVAIKIITKQYLREPGKKDKFLLEIQIHKIIHHPYIAQLFGVRENFINYYLIMEYVPNGSLLDKVISVEFFSENESLHYFTQILSAVQYLHEKLHVVHRDLKLENIIVDENYNCKLIDFGFSHNFDPETEENDLKTPCGSPRYIAPEVFLKKPYTNAVDVWSLGVILFVMVTGKFPFEGASIQLLLHNIQNKEPKFPNFVSSEMKSLILSMLTKDPTQRITIEGILNNQLVSSFMKKSPKKIPKPPQVPSSPLVQKINNDSPIMTTEEKEALIKELNGDEPDIPISLSSDLRIEHSKSSPKIGQPNNLNSASAKLVASGKFKYKPRASLNKPNSTPPPKTLKNHFTKFLPRTSSANLE